jgi:hypothetical protein
MKMTTDQFLPLEVLVGHFLELAVVEGLGLEGQDLGVDQGHGFSLG